MKDIICSISALSFGHLCQKPSLLTATEGNLVRLSCFFQNVYFPTINGIDIFDEIECTENGWSLPDDMKPIWCEHVSCPPPRTGSSEVDVECISRDMACDDKNDQECKCSTVMYKCKTDPMVNTPMLKLYNKNNSWKWIPFNYASCNRKADKTGKFTSTGYWFGSPNPDQIDTVTCREYTDCPKFKQISDSQISKRCMTYFDIDIGCHR